jgi:hypothetical protein
MGTCLVTARVMFVRAMSGVQNRDLASSSPTSSRFPAPVLTRPPNDDAVPIV